MALTRSTALKLCLIFLPFIFSQNIATGIAAEREFSRVPVIQSTPDVLAKICIASESGTMRR